MIQRTYEYETSDGTCTVKIESLNRIDHENAVKDFERLFKVKLWEVIKA